MSDKTQTPMDVTAVLRDTATGKTVTKMYGPDGPKMELAANLRDALPEAEHGKAEYKWAMPDTQPKGETDVKNEDRNFLLEEARKNVDRHIDNARSISESTLSTPLKMHRALKAVVDARKLEEEIESIVTSVTKEGD